MIRERDKALATAHDSCIELVARADQVKDLRDPIRALKQATEAEQAKVAAELSTTVTIDALNARLVDQQAMIDSLIDRIGR